MRALIGTACLAGVLLCSCATPDSRLGPRQSTWTEFGGVEWSDKSTDGGVVVFIWQSEDVDPHICYSCQFFVHPNMSSEAAAKEMETECDAQNVGSGCNARYEYVESDKWRVEVTGNCCYSGTPIYMSHQCWQSWSSLEKPARVKAKTDVCGLSAVPSGN